MPRFLLFLLPFSLFAIPSPFEPNLGQFPSNVLYASHAVAFTAGGPVLRPGVRMSLTGARWGAPLPSSPLAARTRYVLRGAQPLAPRYSEIRYRDVYHGIDLVFHENEY